jgi:hypothetical protein
MGEGWSDFYALALLSEPGDNIDGNYAMGGYATYQLFGDALDPLFMENYYYGIRRYPYSTSLTNNPLTFKDIDPNQISLHPGVPSSPVFPIEFTQPDEAHSIGEVWCAMLWEARANLIRQYGWAVGNQLILQLVTDGMALTPSNPNFVQARDGIIQADRVDTGGANVELLWRAFAKRGLGYSAQSPDGFLSSGVLEAYDLRMNIIWRET